MRLSIAPSYRPQRRPDTYLIWVSRRVRSRSSWHLLSCCCRSCTMAWCSAAASPVLTCNHASTRLGLRTMDSYLISTIHVLGSSGYFSWPECADWSHCMRIVEMQSIQHTPAAILMLNSSKCILAMHRQHALY